jgi:hypothetical protein
LTNEVFGQAVDTFEARAGWSGRRQSDVEIITDRR